jgi:hypothetical protein
MAKGKQRYQIVVGPVGAGLGPLKTLGHTVGTQAKASRAGKANPNTRRKKRSGSRRKMG